MVLAEPVNVMFEFSLVENEFVASFVKSPFNVKVFAPTVNLPLLSERLLVIVMLLLSVTLALIVTFAGAPRVAVWNGVVVDPLKM